MELVAAGVLLDAAEVEEAAADDELSPLSLLSLGLPSPVLLPPPPAGLEARRECRRSKEVLWRDMVTLGIN
jgi:hypothetical protein